MILAPGGLKQLVATLFRIVLGVTIREDLYTHDSSVLYSNVQCHKLLLSLLQNIMLATTVYSMVSLARKSPLLISLCMHVLDSFLCTQVFCFGHAAMLYVLV